MQKLSISPLQFFAEQSGQETGVLSADAGQNSNTADTEQSAPRLSWQELMQDTQYKKEFDSQVQGIIQKRLKGRQDAESTLSRLSPVLAALGKRYGTKESGLDSLDMESIAKELLLGESGEQRASRQQRAKDHLNELLRQERALKESFPDFDLLAAMENPEFVRLTAPHTGLSLEDAYYALHRREIGEATAKNSLEAVTRAVRSGAARPGELSGDQAASSSSDDPRNMTRQQREALKKRIYEAKAQGKKLPYGG